MLRKWRNSLTWILTVSLLFTAAVAFHAYHAERDRYAATYTFYALPAETGGDASALERARMLWRDCRALLKTEAFRATMDDARAEDATCAADASGADGTHLIEITATSESAQVACELANALGEEMLVEARDVLHARDATEIERAVKPHTPYTPNRVLRIALTAALSFCLLSLLGALFGSRRERARYRRAETGALGDTACVGALPDEREIVKRQLKAQRRSGTGTLYAKASERMVEGLREIMLRLRAVGKPDMARVVAATAAKGDCAAVTLLLASALAEQKYRVLLVDMRGDSHELGDLLGARGKRDLADYLAGESALGETLLPTAIRDLTFIDARREAGELSCMLATRAFERFIGAMRAEYDYVLMCTRPSAECADAGMAGMVADLIMLTAEDGRCELGALRAEAGRLSRLCGAPVGVVFTRVPEKRL